MYLAIMKSGTPENNLLQVLRCRESACWTHLSQDFGSGRNNISANWLFVNPRMPVVSLLAFQRSNVASRSRILSLVFPGTNISANWLFVNPRMPVVSLLAFQRSNVASRSRILNLVLPGTKKIYLQVSSIIVQLTLNN